MEWQKPSKKLIDLFEEVVPKLPGIEKKKMFGHPAAFINNNMFMGLNGDRMTIKLPENHRKEFLKLKEAFIFECSPGKKWGQYVEIPKWMYNDKAVLQNWVEKAFEYVSSLPPK